MSNMSYIRFENTYEDLLGCWENWDDDDLSGSEERYQKMLLTLCKRIVNQYDEEWIAYD